MPLPGRHNVANALAAIAASSRLSTFCPRRSPTALADFQNLHQRSEILTLPGEVTVINDCYNSNPLAMERMLETLADLAGGAPSHRGGGRDVGVGADVAGIAPRAWAASALRAAWTWVIAVQGDARFFVEGAVEGGIPTSHVRFFPDAKSAGEFCQTLIAPGDVILVKGSRGGSFGDGN